YALGEFDQALSHVKRARTLSRGDASLANLEAFILIAMGNLTAADALVKETLSREPYNREALFAAAELDVARGKAGEAAVRYREAARRFPDDRRALLSLALVLGSLGDAEGARSYAARATAAHPDDHRVRYYAAYLDAAAGRLKESASALSFALKLKPGYAPARSLLASVRYRLGEWDEAARLADEVIASDRSNSSAWYLKALSYARLGKTTEARSVFALALSVDPNDEFARCALEDLLVSTTSVESAERAKWASYHFNRAEEYRSRNLADQALFEYRRALRIDPYSKSGRAAFADLLRSLGYPARQLAELRFLQELGKADRAINDAVETYDSLLADALHRRWHLDSNALNARHWKIAVVSVSSQSAVRHVDAGRIAATFIRDLLTHDGNISSISVPVEQHSFSSAFRSAREAGADYFLVVSATESERDLSLRGTMYVARTGSLAADFKAFRTGVDRVRNSTRKIVEQLGAALPFRAELIARKAGQGLIDKGKTNKIAAGTKLEIVKKGAAIPLAEGVGLSYIPEDVTGMITISEADEEVSAGTLARNGFFDRIVEGDEVVILPEKKPVSPVKAEAAPADPELRYLLRNLR
ncbi:MAG: tetratricopeptide repeat protein, partial [Treponemataceae bacterium]